MALPDWDIVVSIKDGEGKIGTMTFYHDAALYADARTAALGIAGWIGALTEGIISKVTLTETIQTNATAAPAGSDVEIKGQFTFDNADGKAYQVSVPAFLRSLMLPNSDRINTANADVSDFVVGVLGNGYTDSRAIDLVALRSALEQFTRRRTR